MRSITIIGTGLIGASVGLALKAAGCTARLCGFDANPAELAEAQRRGAIDVALSTRNEALEQARVADVVLLATPVLPILDWMRSLAPVCGASTLITDVGSTKLEIARAAGDLFGPGQASFLPGHPMAGKESGGAALAEATLFENAMWLFTPGGMPASSSSLHTLSGRETHPSERGADLEAEWRSWVLKLGARTQDLDPARHDELCAWVSHLPQFVSTALAALLEARFAGTPEMLEEINAIGGRALRETTRLGASPYSMWRDIALTNTAPVAETLLALEQELAHLRENLRTPELREEFLRANRFRARRP